MRISRFEGEQCVLTSRRKYEFEIRKCKGFGRYQLASMHSSPEYYETGLPFPKATSGSQPSFLFSKVDLTTDKILGKCFERFFLFFSLNLSRPIFKHANTKYCNTITNRFYLPAAESVHAVRACCFSHSLTTEDRRVLHTLLEDRNTSTCTALWRTIRGVEGPR